jgi:hypothetical protein
MISRSARGDTGYLKKIALCVKGEYAKRRTALKVCITQLIMIQIEKTLDSFYLSYTAKTKCRKFETNIPRKGISGPQSQFSHSCVCERIIYSHDVSAFSAGGNMWTDPGNI